MLKPIKSNLNYLISIVNYNFKIGEVIKIFYIARKRNKKRVYSFIGLCCSKTNTNFVLFNKLKKEKLQMTFTFFSPAILKIFIIKMYKPFIFRITKIYFKKNLFLKEDSNFLNAIESSLKSYTFDFNNIFYDNSVGISKIKKLRLKYKYRKIIDYREFGVIARNRQSNETITINEDDEIIIVKENEEEQEQELIDLAENEDEEFEVNNFDLIENENNINIALSNKDKTNFYYYYKDNFLINKNLENDEDSFFYLLYNINSFFVKKKIIIDNNYFYFLNNYEENIQMNLNDKNIYYKNIDFLKLFDINKNYYTNKMKNINDLLN